MAVWGPRSGLGLVVAGAVFAVDRANKHWLVDVYDLTSRGVIELTGFLDLVMVWNRGISYGLFEQDGDLGRAVLVALAVVLSVVLVIWLARTRARAVAVGLGLILGGALSNPVDRLIWGAVADFYRLHLFGYSWYVFNVADGAIVAGAAILLYLSLDFGHKSAEKRR
jgi:signal peptidase II